MERKVIEQMRKGKITILTILFFTLTSFTSKQNELSNDFQVSVDSFIKKYLTDFSMISQRYHSNSNDYILGERVTTIWNKSVTLKCKTPFKNIYNQTTYLRLFLGFYQYDTELQCSNALDSLLNCFGNDCAKIKWGDDGKLLKATPSIYLINEKTIIVCKIHCEQEESFWVEFKKDMITTFGKEKFRVIETYCGGPLYFNEF